MNYKIYPLDVPLDISISLFNELSALVANEKSYQVVELFGFRPNLKTPKHCYEFSMDLSQYYNQILWATALSEEDSLDRLNRLIKWFFRHGVATKQQGNFIDYYIKPLQADDLELIFSITEDNLRKIQSNKYAMSFNIINYIASSSTNAGILVYLLIKSSRLAYRVSREQFKKYYNLKNVKVQDIKGFTKALEYDLTVKAIFSRLVIDHKSKRNRKPIYYYVEVLYALQPCCLKLFREARKYYHLLDEENAAMELLELRKRLKDFKDEELAM